MGRTFALVVCLALALLIAWAGEQTPRPLPSGAPPQAFSAERAMADVRIIARTPHPMGSPANAAVREHLLRRMAALGLQPQVFAAPEAKRAPETLIGILPGRDRAAPAVALMAHYDSVPGSPGAADDAAGVAAILETVRALRATGPLRRDVAVILTDGEETGLLGARAFFREHPLARRLGFVINLEARGGAGKARMFQAGARNGETIELFRQAAPAPSASSLAALLYQIMPNDTDFTLARAAGLQGLNFAFVGGQFDYHAPVSTPANLDRGALQDLGAQALATARAAASADVLPRPAPDSVYNQLPGGVLAAYPAPAGWLLLAAAGALLIVATARARRTGRFAWADAARGAVVGLFVLLAGAALLREARRAVDVGHGAMAAQRLLAHAEVFEAALLLLATGLVLYAAAELARGRRGVLLVPAAAGLIGAFSAGFDPLSLGLGVAAVLVGAPTFWRAAAAPGVWAGLLLTGLAAGVALQAAAPTAAPVVAWPLLIGSAAAAVSGLWTWRPMAVRVAVLIAAAIGLGWLGGFVHGVYLGVDQPELLILPFWIGAMLVWPLAQPERQAAGTPFVAVGVLLAGLLALVWVRAVDPWSARRPKPATTTASIAAPPIGRQIADSARSLG